MTEITMKAIYEKFVNGDSMTDLEVATGARFYTDLGNQLRQCGPVFILAAREATRVGDQLTSYQDARRRK